jgi:hypothetical protein
MPNLPDAAIHREGRPSDVGIAYRHPDGGTASVAVSNSTITGNAIGVLQAGGTVTPIGNNPVLGNGTDVSGTLSSARLR